MASSNLTRILTLLREIPIGRKLTATQLAARLNECGFGLTKRSIERDLAWLSSSGIVALECDDRSKPYGWSYSKTFRGFDFPAMSPPTAMAVKLMSMFMEDILPPPTQRLLREQVGRADAVLERANEDFLRQWPKKIRVLPAGFSPSPPTVSRAVVEAVYSAVLTRRKVHGTYTKADGSSKEHDINIFGIVLRPPITYLVATYRPGHGPFTLALHRLTKARVLDVPTEVPKDFDLDQFIASGELHYRLGGSIQLRVRAAQKIGQLWQETPLSAGQTMTLDKYGWFIVQANVVDSLNLRAYLLGLGDQIEVLGPAALRSTMAEQADSLAKLYPRS